jgi:hypothetical protein
MLPAHGWLVECDKTNECFLPKALNWSTEYWYNCCPHYRECSRMVNHLFR